MNAQLNHAASDRQRRDEARAAQPERKQPMRHLQGWGTKRREEAHVLASGEAKTFILSGYVLRKYSKMHDESATTFCPWKSTGNCAQQTMSHVERAQEVTVETGYLHLTQHALQRDGQSLQGKVPKCTANCDSGRTLPLGACFLLVMSPTTPSNSMPAMRMMVSTLPPNGVMDKSPLPKRGNATRTSFASGSPLVGSEGTFCGRDDPKIYTQHALLLCAGQ